MASTYSNLKIQLMTTGENATTWGNVTNTNLGTALEEAVVGSTNVAFSSGDVTLTLTNTNATQPARHLRLNLTGTTGGSTRNLVVPSIQKAYIVKNGCADSVVVKTAAGTGITVPAGATMWVYSDATNVVDVVNHLSSLTVTGDVTVTGNVYANVSASNITTGTLAVANGGTGVNGAAATNGQLLVGNGSGFTLATLTGSGGVSITNGPGTITIAASGSAGGTVTSVNASGGTTGLSFSGGPITTSGTLTLAGTLGVGYGGTGLTTAPTNGQLLIGTGSAYTLSTLTAGTGVSVTNGSGSISIANTGVTSITAGSGISVSASTGAITISASGGSSGVSSFNTRTGAVTLSSSDVTGALGYTPVPTNGSGASGTWNINVTGNAATASIATSASVANSLNSSNSYVMAGLAVNGAITATGNITAFSSSDIQFKENVADIEGALDKACAIGGKTFDWTDRYLEENGGADGYFLPKQDFGVVAQDVEAAFPLAVRKRTDGSLAVDYIKLTALAFQAIKELRAEVESLKNGA